MSGLRRGSCGLVLVAALGMVGLCSCTATPAPFGTPAALESQGSLAGPQQVRRPQDGDVMLGLGAGVTGGPETFLVSGQVDYFLGDNLSIGPGIHAGLSDDETLIATTFHGRWMMHLADEGDLSRVNPYFQFGAGFLYAEEERRNRSDDDDIGVMLQGGFGLEFAVRDNLTFGSTVMLNLMPSEVLGEHAYVSWEVLRLGFRF